jgi:hypothetical protein
VISDCGADGEGEEQQVGMLIHSNKRIQDQKDERLHVNFPGLNGREFNQKCNKKCC